MILLNIQFSTGGELYYKTTSDKVESLLEYAEDLGKLVFTKITSFSTTPL